MRKLKYLYKYAIKQLTVKDNEFKTVVLRFKDKYKSDALIFERSNPTRILVTLRVKRFYSLTDYFRLSFSAGNWLDFRYIDDKHLFIPVKPDESIIDAYFNEVVNPYTRRMMYYSFFEKDIPKRLIKELNQLTILNQLEFLS